MFLISRLFSIYKMFYRMGLTLHQHGHSHSHHGNESERYPPDTSHNTNHQENINVRAAFIHVVGDFIQSLGVLTAALIIFFKVSSLNVIYSISQLPVI